MNKEKIFFLASQFRQAIEKASKNELSSDISFGSFPNGCCGDASDLLGHYLLNAGIETNHVCGMYYHNKPEGSFQSHAWLEIDDTIIDITGDQFKNDELFLKYDIPVYVGKIDEFHTLFDIDWIRESTFLCEMDDSRRINELIGFYDVILKYI